MVGQRGEGEVIDLLALTRGATAQGAIWSYGGAELNANLVRLAPGEGVGGHVNGEVDVLLLGLVGGGVVELDGRWHELRAGQAIVILRGVCRAIEAGADGFAYLSCHRRRPALWPENVARPAASGG